MGKHEREEEESRPNLPTRRYGTHLPSEAYQERYRKAIGRAKVPQGAYRTDEPAVRFLLNGLRRWTP